MSEQKRSLKKRLGDNRQTRSDAKPPTHFCDTENETKTVRLKP